MFKKFVSLLLIGLVCGSLMMASGCKKKEVEIKRQQTIDIEIETEAQPVIE